MQLMNDELISKNHIESIYDEIKLTGCFDNEFIMGRENKQKSIIDFDNFSFGEDFENIKNHSIVFRLMKKNN